MLAIVSLDILHLAADVKSSNCSMYHCKSLNIGHTSSNTAQSKLSYHFKLFDEPIKCGGAVALSFDDDTTSLIVIDVASSNAAAWALCSSISCSGLRKKDTANGIKPFVVDDMVDTECSPSKFLLMIIVITDAMVGTLDPW